MNDNPLGKCLLCATVQVEQFLDLGSTALANKFLSKEELSTPEPKFPLKVGFCRACGHVQLMDLVPPQAMLIIIYTFHPLPIR